MSGVNRVTILGRLGADPEVKTVNENTVCKMSVATSESWKDKKGEKQERTEWHRVVSWGKLGELCGKYLVKGRQVYIEGRMQTRSWEDDKGVKKYTTEVIASKVEFIGTADTAREDMPTPTTDVKNHAPSSAPPQFDDSAIPF